MDGLSISTVSSQLNKGTLPNIEKFFVGGNNQFNKARVVFPSATSSAIASLLAEGPVDKHGVTGNLVFKDGNEIDYQSPEKFDELNREIKGQNIFARLNAKGLKTVSLDYLFNVDSSVHINPKDPKAGEAYLERNYQYIDDKLIDSLEKLLIKNRSEVWPDFIFLHLIGVDLISHDRGPESVAVANYLINLDAKLKRSFRTLEIAEGTHARQVVAFMSSDHGFDERVKKVIQLEEIVHHVDRKIKLLNEGRFAAFHFPQWWTYAQRSNFTLEIAKDTDIDIVAFRNGHQIFVHSADQDYSFSLLSIPSCVTCFYPYFIPNLWHYFKADDHPDAIVIPKPGIAFHSKYIGQHGGPTPQESFVPLLMHNGSLSNPNQIPELSELLKFM